MYTAEGGTDAGNVRWYGRRQGEFSVVNLIGTVVVEEVIKTEMRPDINCKWCGESYSCDEQS